MQNLCQSWWLSSKGLNLLKGESIFNTIACSIKQSIEIEQGLL